LGNKHSALRLAHDWRVIVLRDPPIRYKALIFPSPTGTALSDPALGASIRRMNNRRPKQGPLPWQDVDECPLVPHGFQQSFRSWVDDTRPGAGEAAEKVLAHEEGNSVRAAYRRSDMLEQRRPLIEEWSGFAFLAEGGS
jgi:integrase